MAKLSIGTKEYEILETYNVSFYPDKRVTVRIPRDNMILSEIQVVVDTLSSASEATIISSSNTSISVSGLGELTISASEDRDVMVLLCSFSYEEMK